MKPAAATYDPEVEQHALCCVLYSGEWPKTRTMTDNLTEADFHVTRHQTILRCLRSQQERFGGVCNEIMLVRQLHEEHSMPKDDAFHLANTIGGLVLKCEPWNIELIMARLADLKLRRQRAVAGVKLLRGEDAEIPQAPEAVSTTTSAKLNAQVTAEIAGVRNALAFTLWPVWSATQCLLPGTLTLLCGSPGVSKSLLAVEALWRWIHDGIPAALLALESGSEFHVRRAVAQHAECANFMRAKWNRENALAAKQIWDEHADFSELIRPFVYSPAALTPGDLLAWLGRMANDRKRVCIVDPVSMMDDGEKAWIGQRRFIWGAKKIAEKHGMSVICVSHPRESKSGEVVRPALDNIPGSKHWKQNSDSIFWLQYKAPEQMQISTPMGVIDHSVNRVLYCLKCRLDENPGKIGFWFNPETLTHKECGKLSNQRTRAEDDHGKTRFFPFDPATEPRI